MRCSLVRLGRSLGVLVVDLFQPGFVVHKDGLCGVPGVPCRLPVVLETGSRWWIIRFKSVVGNSVGFPRGAL